LRRFSAAGMPPGMEVGGGEHPRLAQGRERWCHEVEDDLVLLDFDPTAAIVDRTTQLFSID
jgi:hypothetical protein